MAAAGTVPGQEAFEASAASEVVIVDETVEMPVVGLYLKRTKANGQPALEFFV
jgi:putative N-acetylmannosamine-6-phosphate epimerase